MDPCCLQDKMGTPSQSGSFLSFQNYFVLFPIMLHSSWNPCGSLYIAFCSHLLHASLSHVWRASRPPFRAARVNSALLTTTEIALSLFVCMSHLLIGVHPMLPPPPSSFECQLPEDRDCFVFLCFCVFIPVCLHIDELKPGRNLPRRGASH